MVRLGQSRWGLTVMEDGDGDGHRDGDEKVQWAMAMQPAVDRLVRVAHDDLCIGCL